MALQSQASPVSPPSGGLFSFSGEEVASVSGSPPTPSHETQSLSDLFSRAADSRKKTKLDSIVEEVWGASMSEVFYQEIIKYADPDSARKTKNGFEVRLRSGNQMLWAAVREPGKPPSERIALKKKGKNFSMVDADAMIATARVRGWGRIHVHGDTAHKEMLWLAVQRRNLEEREAFSALQKAGLIPEKDQNGKPVVFEPAVVDNFTPDENSRVMQLWKRDEAAHLAKMAAMGRQGGQVVNLPQQSGASSQATASPSAGSSSTASSAPPPAPKKAAGGGMNPAA